MDRVWTACGPRTGALASTGEEVEVRKRCLPPSRVLSALPCALLCAVVCGHSVGYLSGWSMEEIGARSHSATHTYYTRRGGARGRQDARWPRRSGRAA